MKMTETGTDLTNQLRNQTAGCREEGKYQLQAEDTRRQITELPKASTGKLTPTSKNQGGT